MFGFILSNRRHWFRLVSPLLFIATCGMLAGCLADNSPIVQVVPRTVLAPQGPRFQAIYYVPGSNPATGKMKAFWNRSIADTQLNFKGYLVELWTANYDTINKVDTLVDSLASAKIFRVGTFIPDTFTIFSQTTKLGPYLPTGEYGIEVYGIKADSFGTVSSDSSVYIGLFDPLPLSNPTNLQAESAGPTQVKLHWTPSAQESDTGFYQYVIYYRDTTKTPFDTGHIAALIRKQAGWVDSEALVGVPGVTPLSGSTSEWPYQFWIKAERNDSTFFYGTDTNSVTWAGAERVPRNGNDTGISTGSLQVKNGQSIYFGSLNAQYDVALDTANGGDGKQQVEVAIDNSTGEVTLNIVSPDGAAFSTRIDIDSSLDNIFYSYPVDTTTFSQQSVTLAPSMATSGGVIVYLMMNDDTSPKLGRQWARIFIQTQANGGFINPNGGIDLKASFQPATNASGTAHLPYY